MKGAKARVPKRVGSLPRLRVEVARQAYLLPIPIVCDEVFPALMPTPPPDEQH